jgi:hypothetical protein
LVTALVSLALLILVGLVRGDSGEGDRDWVIWLVFILVGVVFILVWLLVGFSNRNVRR